MEGKDTLNKGKDWNYNGGFFFLVKVYFSSLLASKKIILMRAVKIIKWSQNFDNFKGKFKNWWEIIKVEIKIEMIKLNK